ncbi:MAG TPA: polysaccharide pyruvyl transferase family protein, partial [Candidatus Dormibacteraeota bacterium]
MTTSSIVLAGAYGRGNVGHDLLARVTASALRRDGRKVVVAADGQGTGDPEQARSGAGIWRKLDRDTQLMLGGGELVTDTWTLDHACQLASMCVLARARGASVSAAGVSVEPPATWRGAQLARTVGAAARVLGVRDGASLAVAQRLGARRTLLGVDLGWLAVDELADLLPQAPPPGSRDLVMVTIEGETEVIARRRIALLAGVLRAVKARYPGVDVRLVAMQRHLPAPHDDRALLEHVARFAHLTDAEIVSPTTVEEAAAALRGVTVSLGCRSHGLLLASVCGARIVAVGNKARMGAMFGDLPGTKVFGEPCEVDDVAAATMEAVTSG